MTVERVDSPLAGRRPGPLGPVGGVSALGGQVSSGPAAATPLAERSPAPFWLELKGVERWFDTLDPGERLTLLTSLFGRSSEPQLRQFSAAIDKSLQTAQYATGAAAAGPPPFASNLSRFGVGQSAPAQQSAEYSSLRYHAPMQKQPSGSGNQTAPSAPGTVPQGAAGVSGTSSAASSGAPVGSSASSANAGMGSGNMSAGSINTSSINASMSATSSGSGYMSPLNQPLSAPLGNSQNPFTPSTDLYAQAFLPLPRSKSYTPWGPDIRPKSATADAWPDLGSGRASPQPAQSPNVAALSLEQTSASTSPIGHPIKPWRTFTPVGLGQAPEPFDAARGSRSTQAPQSATLPSSHSSVLGNGISSMSHAPPVPPLNMELNRRLSSSQTGPHSATGPGPQLGAHVSAPFATQFGARAGTQSTSPTQTQRAAHTGAGDESATSVPGASNASSADSSSLSAPTAAAVEAGSPTPSLYALSATGKQSPKRGVNVVDVELLSDIGAWLRSLRLHKYTGNLAGMRWQDVVQLEDADLESRGVNALGARRKLLKMFEEIRQAQEAGLLPDEDA